MKSRIIFALRPHPALEFLEPMRREPVPSHPCLKGRDDSINRVFETASSRLRVLVDLVDALLVQRLA
jgi:hypothetical protein